MRHAPSPPEGQLTDAYYGAIDPVNNPHGPVRSDDFSYDALGNRQGWNYVANKGWMSFLRRNNGLNQYTSWENNDPNPPGHWGTAMSYDDNSPWAPHTAPPGNGVMMAEGNLVASYNALNQPVAMIPTGSPNIYWFGFDPLGRCVKRVVGASAESGTATYFYYDGWNLIQEGPSATASDRIYMLGNRVDEIVADYAPANGQWMFHHSEARGHAMLLTGWNGNLAEQYEYDAFGRPYFFSSTAQPLNLWEPFPLYRPRIPEGAEALRLPGPDVPTRARPLHAARPETFRRRRLQSVPILPQ